jgi:ribosomal protein L19E
MAEELNVDNSEQSAPLSDLSAFDTSVNTEGPDLNKFDAYQNVVGNPVTGSNPKAKAQTDLKMFETADSANDLENNLRQSVASYENPYARMRPYSYNGDYDGANFERYHSTDQYKTLGFSPYRDNESLYNDKMTLGDQFSRAASQWDNLTRTGFKSGIRAWGTLFTDPLAPDMKSADEMKRAMAIGSSGAGGVGGFLINTYLNSGYTYGVVVDFVAEELAMAAATYFTAGVAGEATLPGMAAKAGLAARRLAGFGETAAQTAKILGKGAETERLANAARQGNEALNSLKNGLNTVSDMQSFWKTMPGKAIKGAFDVVNPLENTLKAVKSTDYATGLAKTAKTFGAFADDVIQVKQIVSEAVLEGGMAKMDITEKLIDKYREEHFGQDPEGEELGKIENLANQEAHRVALYNLPAIGVSNKLMYATMIAPISKLIGRGTSTSLSSVLFKKPLKGAQGVAPFEVLGKGMGARAAAGLKSLANPKIYGEFGMNYLKANVAEGVQENLQEAVSTGAVAHALASYSDPTKAAYEGYMGYFLHGLNEQFSAQGAETFAGGFAMGMFVQPVMGSASWTVNRLAEVVNKKEVSEYKARKEAQDQRDAAALNALYADDLRFFSPDLKSSITQQGLAKDFHNAVQNGDEKEARDAQFNTIQNHLSTAIRTGKLDIFLEKLAQYKDLDPKAALEAFSKYGITTEEDAVKAQGQIDGIIARAKNLRNKSENIGSEFPNPYRPQEHQAGSPAHRAAVIASEAWEEAKQNLLYAESAFDDHADRVAKMATTFSGIAASIGKTDAQTFMRLLDPNDTDIELETLKQEIKSLDETLPEQNKIKKEKEKTLQLLADYHGLVKAGAEANATDKIIINKEAKKRFKKYVNHVSGKNNSIVFDTEVNKAYQLILDSHTLKNEMRGLARSINVLNNPKGFLNTQERLFNAFLNIDKEQIVKDNLETSGVITLNNKLHNAMGELGIKLPEEFMDVYNKAIKDNTEVPTPEYFINPKTNERVTEGETFDKAMAIWEAFTEMLPKKEKKETEVVLEPAGFDEKDFNTFPEDLKAELKQLYESYKEQGFVQEGQTIEEFIKDNLIAIKKINEAKSGEAAKKKAETEAIKTQSFEEYKNLSIAELNDRLKDILKAETKDPSVAPERRKIQDALNYKVRAEIKLTPKQQKALDEIERLKKVVKNKDNEKNPYIVEGDRKDLRVTQLVDTILEKEFPTYKKFYFAYKADGTPGELLALYNSIAANESFQDTNLETQSKKIMSEFVKQAKDVDGFESRFNSRKLNAMQQKLAKTSMTEEDFATLLDEYVYEETSIRGNTLDRFGRDFFEGIELNPANYDMTEKAFEQARQIFIKFNQDIASKGEIIISNGLVVWGTTTDINGKPQTFGGEMDLLVITPEGEYKIYDMKTANNWANFGVDRVNTKGEVVKEEYHKKDRYSLQLGIYKNALENLTSIPVPSINLLALQTKQDLDGRITDISEAGAVKNKVINYNEIKPILDKYVPSKLEQDIKPATTFTEEEAKRIDQFNRAKKGSLERIKESNNPQVIFTEINRLQEALKNTKGSELTPEEQTFIDEKLKELKDKGYTFIARKGTIIQEGEVIDLQDATFLELNEIKDSENELIQEELNRRKKLKQKFIDNGLTEEEAIIKAKLHPDDNIDIVSRDVEVTLLKDGVLEKVGKVTTRYTDIKTAELAALEGKTTEEVIEPEPEQGPQRLADIGTAPSPQLIARAAKLGFTEETVVAMTPTERDEIRKATSKDDVKDLLAKYAPVKVESTNPIDKAIKTKQTVQEKYAIVSSVGRRKSGYNSKVGKWEFYTTNNELITNQVLIKELSKELVKKPNVIYSWWTALLSNKQRDNVKNYFDKLHELYKEGFSFNKDFSTTPYVLIMEDLSGRKFKIGGDVDKNVADLNRRVWLSKEGESVDRFVHDSLIPHLDLYGGLDPSKDELDYIDLVYELINNYPNGIKSKDIQEYIEDTQVNKPLFDLNDSFVRSYGLDLNTTFNTLFELKQLDYETSTNSEITNEELTGSETYLGEFEDLEERAKTEEAFDKTIDNAYKGAFVFMSPGSGKTSFSRKNSNIIDADDLTLSVIKEVEPSFEMKKYDKPGKAIYDFLVDRKTLTWDQLYTRVYEKAQIYMNMGKTVVTGSSNLMKFADYVFIQENKMINEARAKEGYDVQKELKKVNELNKPFIIINDYTDNILKQSPEELRAKTPWNFKYAEEITGTEEVTPEELKKDINSNSLTKAMEKNYDVIYKNNRYSISKIEEKTVSLTDLQGDTITVNQDDITSIEDSKTSRTEGEEIDTVRDNTDAIKKSDIKLTPGITKKDALNNIKNKKCN